MITVTSIKPFISISPGLKLTIDANGFVGFSSINRRIIIIKEATRLAEINNRYFV